MNWKRSDVELPPRDKELLIKTDRVNDNGFNYMHCILGYSYKHPHDNWSPGQSEKSMKESKVWWCEIESPPEEE